MVRHITKFSDFTKEEVMSILEMAIDMKKNPSKYREAFKDKTLLMLFEKPSLRTRVSFEVGMTQMGGHAIYYDVSTSPLGKKENISDTAKCLSRFCDFIMARVMTRQQIRELAANATIPVVNGLDDFAHPCQIMADLQCILEKKGTLRGLKWTYCGDACNNVTYDIMRAGALLGFEVAVASPAGAEYSPEKEVLDECAALCKVSGGKVWTTTDAQAAAHNADVIYTDSWMSYHVDKSAMEARIKIFTPYRVTKELMSHGKKDCIFMNCLPANRDHEQTAEVIDGPQSVVFDEAENRLHAQKSILYFLHQHK